MDKEYFILCPQRPENEPGLITHLISVDICAKRQEQGFHKCPNCVRSEIWQKQNADEVPARKKKTAAAKQ